MENMKKAKYTAFGLGPIAAYIFARMTEIAVSYTHLIYAEARIRYKRLRYAHQYVAYKGR